MTSLIYQYWKGSRPEYSYASEEAFRNYADSIKADYHLGNGQINLRCLHKRYFAALLPVLKPDFDKYDSILYVDMDVMPAPDLKQNIFDLAEGHIMMSEEGCQPELRTNMQGKINSTNDIKWANIVEQTWAKRPLEDHLKRPRVFNSGVVLYTREGIAAIRNKFPSILRYQIAMKLRRLPKFYSFDQNYLNAFINLDGIDFRPLAEKWNSQLLQYFDGAGRSHILDRRETDTCFTHVQPGAIKKSLTQQDMKDITLGTYDLDANL